MNGGYSATAAINTAVTVIDIISWCARTRLLYDSS